MSLGVSYVSLYDGPAIPSVAAFSFAPLCFKCSVVLLEFQQKLLSWTASFRVGDARSDKPEKTESTVLELGMDKEY